MDPTRSMGSLGAIPMDNLATLAGPVVFLAVAYWYIKVHGFIYAASLAWTVVGVVKTILTVPFNMVYWVVASILMIPYYLLMVILSPLAWLWHAFMAPFYWFLRFLGDPYPVIIFFTIAIIIGLCSGVIISLTSAIASSFIHSFASSSIRPRKQAPTVVPTNLNLTNSNNNNNNNNPREARERDRPSRTGFLNPLALNPVPSSSPQSRTTRQYNPYDADNELVHIEYPNLSDTTNSPTLKQRNGGGTSYFDQQQQQAAAQRSPKSISSPGPPQLHARPRSAVAVVKRGLGLSAIGGMGTTGLVGVGVGSGATLLRETIHEEEDSGSSGDDSV
ncbi:hypothetical protein B0H65DRAFT_568951 [Neurospora tetraspora]|uniref:Uncharacterized protein n=1 Tax=Neurospora tetraspora TaxID=94610 RepID=A0AAE0JL66_9PEZI|nr:hypothetical protein B0H65DRAFT_568951 [Neurospora tetraspora]